MKKLAFSAMVIGSLGLLACGGGGDDKADAFVPNFIDGGDGDGGGTNPGACNPVNQTGCDAGEKCAQLVVSMEPFLARTACVPEGGVPAGGDCVQGEPGETTGFDDCVKGYECSNGKCVEICTIGPPDSCTSEDEACVLFENLYDDVGDNNIGLCQPACDPVTGHLLSSGEADPDNSCLETQGCYLAAVLGSSTCANVPQPASEKFQNMGCYGPVDQTGAQVACYLNGCAAGFGPIHNNPVQQGSPISFCSLFCTPQNSYDDDPCAAGATCPATGNPTGDPGTNAADGQVHDCSLSVINAAGGGELLTAGHQCRFVQSFYNNTDLVPASVGFCVSTDHRGDCSEFPESQLDKAFTDCANQVPECTDEEYEAAFVAACPGANLMDPNNPIFGVCEASGCTSLEFDTFPDPASAPGVAKGRQKLREFLNSRKRPTFHGQIPLPDGRVLDFSQDPNNPTIL